METLTAAAIATLLVTKMVEKLGESIGEKIPELGGQVWEQVSKLKTLLKRKVPETAAVLEAAENAPSLIESQPTVFGLPVLSEKMAQAAATDREVADIIDALVVEVKPQLSATFQEKVVQQTMLKGVRGKTIRGQGFRQTADPAATQTHQEMLIDVEAKGDIDLGNLNQTA
ncbi:MAG: hypothetical protein O2890_14200 [Cyanobacteria bacterium]|nr:hypothetical protein [Cyanobacteriota bacterium]